MSSQLPPLPDSSLSKPEQAFYCRKEKSLAVLCSNFLNLYDKDGVESIGLDDAATRLGVERRRIYDIVNILESVGVMKRKAKNQYFWNGFDAIPRALNLLKEEGLSENLSTSSCSSSANISGETQYRDFSEPKTDAENRPSGSSKSERRKEKSLGILTQQFVKLFLCSKAELISLDDAATVLLGEIDDPTAMRTKVRRLYDIANVFSSMNLIQKIQHPESRKPAFKWLGLRGRLEYAKNRMQGVQFKEPKRRAFGTDITNTSSKKCKTDLLTGSHKIHKEVMPVQAKRFSTENEQERSILEQQEKHNSKGFVFGPFTPANPQPRERLLNKNVDLAQNLEALASYRPKYRNEDIFDLFTHYSSAWKTWYAEAEAKEKVEEGS